MQKFTICFIRQDKNILLLNRDHPRWMGSWNGVGGKIEKGESPNICILREVIEETGIKLSNIKYKGTINRIIDNNKTGEIYAFVSDLPTDYIFNTPIKISEGILDWKEVSWILHPQNTGIASDVPYFLPTMLQDDNEYEYLCVFHKDTIIDFSKKIIIS